MVRNATSSSYSACGAAWTSRRSTWMSAATWTFSRARRSTRPARGVPRAPCRFRCTRRSQTSRRSALRGWYGACWPGRRETCNSEFHIQNYFMLSYIPIYIAAIIEGEIYYSKVCADAIAGRLFWPAVLTCGALGGATGDQLWFYVLRGRIHWLDRYPRLARYRDSVVSRVHRNESGLVLVSRFLPGLRTAIPIACA